MPSERLQSQIERVVDEAEDAFGFIEVAVKALGGSVEAVLLGTARETAGSGAASHQEKASQEGCETEDAWPHTHISSQYSTWAGM